MAFLADRGGEKQQFTEIPVIRGTYQPAILDALSSAVVQSPYNWSEGRGGPGSMQTLSPGAYVRFYFTGCSSVTLMFDPLSAGVGAVFRLQFDNGVLSPVFEIPQDGKVPISFQDAGPHCVTVLLSALDGNGPSRWNREQFCGIIGMHLGDGGRADEQSVVRGKRNVLIYGDSITEGVGANNGVSDITCAYSYMVAEALRNIGFEYGIVGCGGQGYLSMGTGQTPPLSLSWDKIDANNNRLFGGLLKPLPDMIFDNHGVNDGNHSMLPTVVSALYRSLRKAAPSAYLFKLLPFSGAWREPIRAALQAYQASVIDPRVSLIDLNIDHRILSGLYTGFGDNTHPGLWGHAHIASMLTAQIMRDYMA